MTSEALEAILRKLGIEPILRNNDFLFLCPFHEETRPSCGISVNHPHLYGCFGCGARGSIVGLLIKLGNYSVVKAKEIAGVAESEMRLPNLALNRPSSNQEEIDPIELYPFVFDQHCANYALSRGILPSTARKLGWLYDHNQNRVLFPWYFGNRLVGLTGRSLDASNLVKTLPYFNTKKKNILYLPQRKLFGKYLVIVEGETDAAKIYDCGYHNVAATGFGGFSDEHLNLILKSGADTLIIFRDCDGSGFKWMQDVTAKAQSAMIVRRVDYFMLRDLDLPASYTGKKLDPAELKKPHIHLLIRGSSTDIFGVKRKKTKLA